MVFYCGRFVESYRSPGRNLIKARNLNLEIIGNITRQINSTMQLDELLTVILETAKELVHSEGASLLLAEPKSGDLTFNIVLGDGGDLIKGEKVPRGKGIVGLVAQTEEPMIVNDWENDPRIFKDIDQKSKFQTRSILCVPMMVQGKLVGVLDAVNAVKSEGYDEWDLELLSYLADQAAIAITNRRLFDELNNRIAELTALFEISQAISLAKTGDQTLSTIVESIAESLHVDKCSLLLYNRELKKLVLSAGRGLPEGVQTGAEVELHNSVAGHVFISGMPLVISDRIKDLPGIPPSSDRSYSTGSFVSVPIRYMDEIIGILNISDKKDRTPFTDFDLRVVSTVANHVAETWQNIQYQKRMEAQRLLAQEIEIAAEIQRKILQPIPAEVRHHRMAAFNRPAKEVGGDFYDFFRFDENKYSVLVGDVSGKGIPAALFMNSARNIIRAEMRIHNQPGVLLAQSNRYIYEESESGMFVTLFYALVDVHNNILTYGSAGHNDQFLIRNKGRKIERLNAKGGPLGLKESSAYEERVITYESGDLLLLFTDGVVDFFGEGSLEKGEDLLLGIVSDNFDKDPLHLTEHFKNKLTAGATDSYFMDDFTILPVRF